MRKFFGFLVLLGLVVSAGAQLPTSLESSRRNALDRLANSQPGVKFLTTNGRIERIYGPMFGAGATPEAAFRDFASNYADAFTAGTGRLELVGLQTIGRGRFTAGTLKQFYGPIPVDRGQVTLLARNEVGSPIVLAVNGAVAVRGNIGSPTVSAKQAIKNLQKHHPTLKDFEKPTLVIWDGELRSHLAWTFIASSPTSLTGCTTCGSIPEQVEAFVDAETGEVLEERQAIWTIDVNGNVSAWATPGLKPDEAINPPTFQPLNNLRVNITSGNFAFSGSDGSFTIANSGSTDVTVNAPLTGRWARVVNQAQATSSLSQIVTPPGPANFIYNGSPAQFTTAEVNGYIHTDRVHNFVKSVNPVYPVDIQLPVNVNVSGSCNAFYNGSSTNFYRAATTANSCPNMAYSTVIYHEYGHFVVDRGGTGQGAYGEGMSDTIANLLVDHPWTGEDFRGPNTGPLRSAINNVTYPSVDEIHIAGQIVSGAFWNTLLQMDAAVGHAEALGRVREWAIDSILLHPPGVTPGLVVDVLTLDDNDGDITNGTPHYAQIAAGFGAKNLVAPPVEWVRFQPVQRIPTFAKFSSFSRTIPFVVEITSHGGTLDPATPKLFYRLGNGNWQSLTMVHPGGDTFVTHLNLPPSGTVIEWYLEAADTMGRLTRSPLAGASEPARIIVAESLVTVVEDFMETGSGWSVANTSLASGAWVRGNPNPTDLNGWTANPGDDANDPGVNCFFTGQAAIGGGPGDQDVDGGPTQLTSPTYDLAGGDSIIEYKRWFFNDDGDDALVVEVSNDNGATWHAVETVMGVQNTWVQRSFRLGKFVSGTSQVKLRFSTMDEPNNSVTEAGVDHLVIRRIVP